MCDRCGSNRIMTVSGKTSDMCYVQFGDNTSEGYVPEIDVIGGGDYLEIDLCMECGKVQGTFPIPDEAIYSVL